MDLSFLFHKEIIRIILSEYDIKKSQLILFYTDVFL